MKIKRILAGILCLATVGASVAVTNAGVENVAVNVISANAETLAETSGTCGDNANWVLSEDGTLTISGSGDMTDYCYAQVSGKIESPFLRAEEIKNVVIEDGITSVGDEAFHGCPNLKTIVMADSVKTIGTDAFFGCEALESLKFSDSLEEIKGSAFGSCNSLKEVVIPDSVKYLGAGVFKSCSALESATVGNSVKEIPETAFYECKRLENITIGKSVEEIGLTSFTSCPIKKIYISDIIPFITSYSTSNLKDSESGYNLYIDGKLAENITIPDTVTKIGNKAFHNCKSIKSVKFPKATVELGEYSFDNCSALESVEIAGDISSIPMYFFQNCVFLKTVTIPGTVESIGNWGFYKCPKLADVYWNGTEAQFNKLKDGYGTGYSGDSNADFRNATVHIMVKNAGDLNNDNNIDSKDAVIVLKSYAETLVGKKTSVSTELGDVNGDGKLDSKDAVIILRYYAAKLAGVYNGNIADFK